MSNFSETLAASAAAALLGLVISASPAPAAPLVAAGESVSTYALDDGFLWASGSGSGSDTDYAPTSPLALGRSWTVLHSTHGIDSDGALWSWGSGDLGVPSVYSSFYPVRVGAETWRSVSANHFAVRNDGTLWGWGNHFVGGTSILDSQTPVRFGTGEGWRFVTGGNYNLAIKNDGSLWAWGHNGHGNLGDGTTTLRAVPVRIGSGNDWASAACVDWTSFGIKTDGSLWAWGGGAYGDGNPNGASKVPVRVGTGSNWRKISGRNSVVLGLRTDGSLWSWGQSSYGMLGLGSVTSQPVAARIGQETTWADVAVGQRHVVASRIDGSLWGWGRNSSREYGLTGVDSSNVPLEITSAFVPAPEFQVLRNGYPYAVDYQMLTLGPAILGEPVIAEIALRNSGAAPLILSAGELPGFTITCPAEIPALATAVLRIRLDAAQTGSFGGNIALTSNDPARPLFTFSLGGSVVSPADDTDSDGMNDAAEVALYALGFRWESAQPDLVAAFEQNVGFAGLHLADEVLDIHWQAAAPEMDGSGETIVLPLEMRSGGDAPAPVLTPENLRQAADQALELSVPLPPGKRLLRLRHP